MGSIHTDWSRIGLVTDRASRILTSNVFVPDPPLPIITPRVLSAAWAIAILTYFSHPTGFASDPPANGAQLCTNWAQLCIIGALIAAQLTSIVHQLCTIVRSWCTTLRAQLCTIRPRKTVHRLCTIVHNACTTLCTQLCTSLQKLSPPGSRTRRGVYLYKYMAQMIWFPRDRTNSCCCFPYVGPNSR